MFEVIIASLLFHGLSGIALVLLASGAAARDLHSPRLPRISTLATAPVTGTVPAEGGSIIELPARAPKTATREMVEARPEAA